MSPTVANRALFVLSIGGAVVAGYLTVGHLNYLDITCGSGDHGCDKVALHSSAHGFGIPALHAIPTATFGAAMYVVLAALAFTRVAAGPALARKAQQLQLALLSAGMVVEVYLIYTMKYVIQAWCQWCLASGAILTLMFIISLVERLRRPVQTLGETT